LIYPSILPKCIFFWRAYRLCVQLRWGDKERSNRSSI